MSLSVLLIDLLFIARRIHVVLLTVFRAISANKIAVVVAASNVSQSQALSAPVMINSGAHQANVSIWVNVAAHLTVQTRATTSPASCVSGLCTAETTDVAEHVALLALRLQEIHRMIHVPSQIDSAALQALVSLWASVKAMQTARILPIYGHSHAVSEK